MYAVYSQIDSKVVSVRRLYYRSFKEKQQAKKMLANIFIINDLQTPEEENKEVAFFKESLYPHEKFIPCTLWTLNIFLLPEGFSPH